MSPRALFGVVIGLSLLPASVAAQDVAPVSATAVAAPVAAEPPLAEGFVRIPANTPVSLQIVDAQSSKTSQIDGMFAISLADPVIVDGKTVLPAGIAGQGQVVHASKAKGLGKGGELILAARFLTCGGEQIALRGFRFNQAGSDKTGQLMAATLAVGVIATPLMFMKGGESIVPAGTLANARLSKSVDVEISPVPQCAGTAPTVGATPPPVAPPTPTSTPAPEPAIVSTQEGKTK